MDSESMELLKADIREALKEKNYEKAIALSLYGILEKLSGLDER